MAISFMPWSVTTHSTTTAAVSPFNSRDSFSRWVFHRRVIDFALSRLISVSCGLQLVRWGSLPNVSQLAAFSWATASGRQRARRAFAACISMTCNYNPLRRRSTGNCDSMSRPSEKFLIEPSRKFLLTAVRQKDGTNRDEPRGTRLAGLVEASQRREDDAAGSGRADGGERALGTGRIILRSRGHGGCIRWK